MAMMWTSVVKNRNKIVFLVSLIVLGFLCGIVYYKLQNEGMKEVLKEGVGFVQGDGFRVNNLMEHLVVMSVIVILVFVCIGLPGWLFYLFYEGLSFGFSLSLVVAKMKFGGLWMMVKYFLTFKLVYMPFLVMFGIKVIDCTRNIVGLVVYRGDERIKRNLVNNLRKLMVFFVFIVVIDIVVYFLSPLVTRYLVTF